MKENIESNPGPLARFCGMPPTKSNNMKRFVLLVVMATSIIAFRIPGTLDIRQTEYIQAYDPIDAHQLRPKGSSDVQDAARIMIDYQIDESRETSITVHRCTGTPFDTKLVSQYH